MIQQQNQFTVQDTNDQSLVSKISAIRKGYYNDPFAEQFSKFRQRKQIIIHRGYWARVYIVRKVVQEMLKYGSQVQIISLGCGLQTMWFNLSLDQNFRKKNCLFVGLDLPKTIHKKITKILESSKIMNLLNQIGQKLDISQKKDRLIYGNMYKVAACDITNLQSVEQIFNEFNINLHIPTLFYSECVLSYIFPEAVDNFLSFINKKFDLNFFFAYEMLNPNDRFGKMMLKNFNERGCPLYGLQKYQTLEDQINRFKSVGYQTTQVYTMRSIYYDCIDPSDRFRIQKLQMLDELQEWYLIMQHYFAMLAGNWNQKGSKHIDFQSLINGMKLKVPKNM